MPARRAAVTVLAVALSVTLLAACGGGEERLTIYSGRSQSLVEPLLTRFSEETGIPIDVRYGDSAELALLLGEEGEGTDADVFYSQSPGATGYVAGRGLLAELPEELTARVDERFRSAEGRWVGVTGRQRVLVYNSEELDEADLPQSVLDVTNPEFAGRVAVAPENGSFQDFVSALRQAEGDEATLEWLTALAEGGAPTYANNNAIVEAVARGEVPMGLVNHYYNERFLEEDPDLPSRNHVFGGGDLGALVIPSTVSIVEGTDQREAAEEFVAYLLSEDAQRYFADETKEYPLAAGVEPAAETPPLDTANLPSYDVDALGGELEGTLELIRESGLGG
jgi:iron(III) transport system substrate-binding protein